MLAKGSAALQSGGIGFALARAPMRRFDLPPEQSEYWAGALSRRRWPDLLDLGDWQPSPWVEPIEPPPPRIPYAKQKQYRASRIAAGLCARCGQPRQSYATNCDPCQQKVRAGHARWSRRKMGHRPWRPGGHGAWPTWARAARVVIQDALAAAEAAFWSKTDADLRRAAVITMAGLHAHFDVALLAYVTKYDRRFVQRCADGLIAAGVWRPDEHVVACEWLDDQRPLWHREVALMLDAMVGLGLVTRSQDDGGKFLYAHRSDGMSLRITT